MFLSPTEDKAHPFSEPRPEKLSHSLLPSYSNSQNVSVPNQNIVYMEKCVCSITGTYGLVVLSVLKYINHPVCVCSAFQLLLPSVFFLSLFQLSQFEQSLTVQLRSEVGPACVCKC